jgi:hypothetical protein
MRKQLTTAGFPAYTKTAKMLGLDLPRSLLICADDRGNGPAIAVFAAALHESTVGTSRSLAACTITATIEARPDMHLLQATSRLRHAALPFWYSS